MQRKGKNLRADLQLWWLTAGLYSFGSAAPGCSGAQGMPASPSSHAAASVGPWQGSDLKHQLQFDCDKVKLLNYL